MTADDWSAVRLSLLVAGIAVAGGLPLAIPIGYLLARWRGRGRWVVETLVNLPLVLPPVVTGYLLLVVCGRQGPVGRVLEAWFGLRLVFTWYGAAVAAGVISFPLMVRALRVAFAGIDPRLELMAETLGASRLDAAISVALPLAWRGVLAAAILGFARSLGEFGATILIAGNIIGQTQTIPLAIYSRLQRPDGIEQAWPLVALAVLLAAGALGGSEWLEHRSGRS